MIFFNCQKMLNCAFAQLCFKIFSNSPFCTILRLKINKIFELYNPFKKRFLIKKNCNFAQLCLWKLLQSLNFAFCVIVSMKMSKISAFFQRITSKLLISILHFEQHCFFKFPKVLNCTFCVLCLKIKKTVFLKLWIFFKNFPLLETCHIWQIVNKFCNSQI